MLKASDWLNNSMSETWKTIGDWPYAISDKGRVMRLTKVHGTRPGKILKPLYLKDGYVSVYFSDGARIRKRKPIHRLVLETFLSPCPPGKQANHINGIRDDNRLSNLEWVSPSENQIHAYKLRRNEHEENDDTSIRRSI